jgi:nucleotide-binding universal stress UspA family protein
MKGRRTHAGARPVMVGVDGSPEGERAALFGAFAAKRRRLPLLLVHGYVGAIAHLAYGWTQQRELATAVREDARRMLADMELRAHAAHPGLSVRSTLVAGSGASALVELSRTASLVVVGARGRGGFAGLRLGSVGNQVVAHAHAPVVVVRPAVADLTSAPIVVGVDGSPASEIAIGFAFEEAAARGVGLVALHAWWMLPRHNLGPTSPRHYDPAQAADEAQRMLAEAVAGWSEKYPDVRVDRVTRHHMDPALAVIEASHTAAMVVVGSRGRGGFASMLLGSVSRTVVTHAECPVAVVREIEE